MNRRTFTKTALSLPLLGALPTISRGDFDSEAERIAEYILRRKVGIKHSRGVRQGKSEITYRDWETDRKSTRLNSSHSAKSRMPSSA